MTTLGFYGKLASRGDFVSRALPQSFIGPWDSWLAAGLLASQHSLGGDWLNVYLVSPLWRFVLAPGVCGPDAAAGVVMPSIDRVGRYFPLAVVTLLDHDTNPASLVGGPDTWFEQAEELLLHTLDAGATFEGFNDGLDRLGLPLTGELLAEYGPEFRGAVQAVDGSETHAPFELTHQRRAKLQRVCSYHHALSFSWSPRAIGAS